MKKTLLNNIQRLLVLGAVIVLVGCESTKKEVPAFVPIDYTAENAAVEEIKRIEAFSEEEVVKGLWRAKLLLDNTDKDSSVYETVKEEFETKVSVVKDLYDSSLQEKKYLDAYRYFTSLNSCGYDGIDSLKENAEGLVALINNDVPGLKAVGKAGSENAKVSSLIKGTVTVYVDKGLRFEKGLGYADGVIGSGFFISKDGYLITNNHVIEDCVNPKNESFTRLYIRLAEDPDTKIPAKVVGYDSILDLALLKAEVDAPYVFELGESSSLDVGDKVYAIGSPLGLDRTLTSGIISSKDRKLMTIGNVFQVDAAINSGNSGGPLIDEKGRVQAIVFAGVQNYQGLNFAIPVEYLKSELPVLFNSGKREHPWVAAYGRTKKLPGSGAAEEGIEVQYIMPGGSASLGGLKADDVITSFNGLKISSLDSLQNETIRMMPETIVTVKATSAEGEEKECLLYLSKRPEQPGYEIYTHDTVASSFIPLFGMKLVSVSTISKKKFTVGKVLKGSVADEMSFSENDPVDILKVEFNDEKSAAYVEIYTKKRKNGYINVSLGLSASMDSPYYF